MRGKFLSRRGQTICAFCLLALFAFSACPGKGAGSSIRVDSENRLREKKERERAARLAAAGRAGRPVTSGRADGEKAPRPVEPARTPEPARPAPNLGAKSQPQHKKQPKGPKANNPRGSSSAQIQSPDGVTAALLMAGGLEEADRKPIYQSGYYSGGYPPAGEGVCTDVIWRAYRYAGYDLKANMDADIRANPSAYPRVGGKPDANIDFRRVPNQRVFFARHGQSLTTKFIPHDKANMAQWRPGDLVSFQQPDHIAIISDKRNASGYPYLIHNDGPWASEGDDWEAWSARGITGHYRFLGK